MIDTTTPDTPGWWLNRLVKQLNDEAGHLNTLDSYFQGVHVLPVTTKATREAYRRLQSMSRTNFAELVVEAVRERMVPTGFRTGLAGDRTGDAAAWAMWQANSLDADKDLVHRPMLSMGKAYVIVGPVDAETGAPVITPEDPRQVIAECDPVHRRRVRAALKVFRDDVAGVDLAYLYLPGRVITAKRVSDGDYMKLEASGFDWVRVQALPEAMKSVVPVVPFLNRPTLGSTRVAGEFEPHLGILDRINYSVLSRLEIATLQAFRQRAVKGVPTHDAKGVEIDYSDIFNMDPGALWQLPATAEMWESGIVDLGPIRSAIRDDIQDLAAVTRTPMQYLSPGGVNLSAEGTKADKEGLIFKAQDRITHTTESWERVESLAFLFAGDLARANRSTMQMIWAPPERHSLAEKADAAGKALAAGVPWQTVMESIMQYTPQEIDAMRTQRAEDQLVAAIMVPPVAASAVAG